MYLGFGKYKGQEIEEIVKTTKGREYLQWLVDQPVEHNKWEADNLKRNKEISEILSASKKTEETTGGEANPREVPEMTASAQLQNILMVLERIEANQRKLLTKDGIQWDE